MTQLTPATLAITINSDIVVQSDSNYSSGLEVSYLEAKHTGNLLAHSQLMALLLPKHSNHLTVLHNVSHHIWTPEQSNQSQPQSYDRPYAATLSLTHGLSAKLNNWTLSNWLELGVMGPNAYGELLQKFVHKHTDSTEPQGWQFQVENQAIPNLGFAGQYNFLPHSPFTFASYLSGEFGSTKKNANAGLTMGFSKSNLNTDVDAGLSQLTHSNGQGFSIFVKLEYAYHLYDHSIKGQLPHDSYVSLKPQQAKVEVALNYNWIRHQLQFSLLRRSNNFSYAQSLLDDFASLTYRYRF